MKGRRPRPLDDGGQVQVAHMSRRRVRECEPRTKLGVFALKTLKVEARIALRPTCGQGQDRTVDLPLFRRTLVPTELPGHLTDLNL